MTDVTEFGLIVCVCAAAFLVAVLSRRISLLLRVPAPAIFLLGAALVSHVVAAVPGIPVRTTERLVTVALVVILFDGGMHIGWRRFRLAGGAVLWLGVAGTAVTALGVAAVAHLLFQISWFESLLLGTALAPTDPAVVFSVLGGQQVGGRAGILLEGESGANDPVGIALMVALLGAHASGGGAAIWHGLLEFALEMVVGIAIGVVGGLLLRWFMQAIDLRGEGLDAVRMLAGAYLIYGLATLGHGSGFLAVLTAGVLLGDVELRERHEIRVFHTSLASVAEIVAFVVLGLTVDLTALTRNWAWLIGLVVAVLLAFVIRPVLCGLVLWPIDLPRGERLFVLWSGLKGAVPILLGLFIVSADLPDEVRLYTVIFVVVAFSVIVQGGLVPTVARRLRVPMTAGE